jgi:NADP-dependent aldehyde dehydrogenase
MLHPVLIAGHWKPSKHSGTFRAEDPRKCKPLDDEYPISTWDDCDRALAAASEALEALRRTPPAQIAALLDAYAAAIESQADALCEIAHLETALPVKPRLRDVELPRTTNQLRQAAAAARDGSWSLPTIDTKLNIRSRFAAIGPVCVFGPNNFPFAFNSASGGDFAAAIAAGNPVIAKANTSHPGTTRLFAELAQKAVTQCELHPATVQLIYRTSHADGERLVSDPRAGATGYTGSREAGLNLKAAADRAGKPIYLELSSINPVVILPGAIAERLDAIADEFTASCLMGTGQFCTNPGLLLLIEGDATERFIAAVADRFRKSAVGTLLSGRVGESLASNIDALKRAGAQVVVGASTGGGEGCSYANTLLRANASDFVRRPQEFQREAFGNASLCIVAQNADELTTVIDQLEGNLTGCVYSAATGSDDALYDRFAVQLRPRVGRLLNDKMPTGVAVSPAMNHGGPYPATGHPGFTAVGIPAALRRFAVLECFDNVRPARLPEILTDKNPSRAWRLIDNLWTQANIPLPTI